MVMEKSWNMKNWPKVLEFCDSVMEFDQFCPQFVCNLFFLVTTKKLGSDLESQHFCKFSAKHCEFKIGVRDGHGKSRNGHGKIFSMSLGTLKHREFTKTQGNLCA